MDGQAKTEPGDIFCFFCIDFSEHGFSEHGCMF